MQNKESQLFPDQLGLFVGNRDQFPNENISVSNRYLCAANEMTHTPTIRHLFMEVFKLWK